MEYDYTISDIAKYSDVSFMMTTSEIIKLAGQEIVVNSRNMGNTAMYKINPDSEQTKTVNKLAMAVASKRIASCMKA